MANIKAASIPDLEERITALEEKLGERWPGDVCRACGARGLRLQSAQTTFDERLVEETWRCSACGQIDVRLVRPR